VTKLASLAVIATMVSLAPATLDAKCAFVEPKSQVITPADTVIEDGGGVLVVATGYPRDNEESDKQPTWRFAASGKRFEPVMERLAPGLVVYKPAPGLTASAFVLENDKHQPQIAVKRSDTRNAPKLAAPVIRSVDAMQADRGRFSSTSVTVHLPAPAPSGAMLLVIYGVDERGNRTARSYGQVHAGDKDVIVYHSGHCSFPPKGTLSSAPGETVAVAWIDRSGRASEPSRPINVVAAHDEP